MCVVYITVALVHISAAVVYRKPVVAVASRLCRHSTRSHTIMINCACSTRSIHLCSMRHLKVHQPEWSTNFSHTIAGGLAGLSQVAISCPSDLIKIQMQCDHGSTGQQFARTSQAAKYFIAQHGFLSLFRGWQLTMVRDTTSYAIYFGVYDALKGEFARRARREPEQSHWYSDASTAGHSHRSHSPSQSSSMVTPRPPSSPQPNNQLSASALMFSGGMAGVASWLFLHPVDVVKSLQQGMPFTSSPSQTTVSAIVRLHLQTSGPAFLLRGLLATCLRAFPCSAVTFPIFEWMVAVLNRGIDSQEWLRPNEPAAARDAHASLEFQGGVAGSGPGRPPLTLSQQHAAVAQRVRHIRVDEDTGDADTRDDLEIESVAGGSV